MKSITFRTFLTSLVIMTSMLFIFFFSLQIYYTSFYEKSKLSNLSNNLMSFIEKFEATDQASNIKTIQAFNEENNADLIIIDNESSQYYSAYEIENWAYGMVISGYSSDEKYIEIPITTSQMTTLPHDEIVAGTEIQVSGIISNSELLPSEINGFVFANSTPSNYTSSILVTDTFRPQLDYLDDAVFLDSQYFIEKGQIEEVHYYITSLPFTNNTQVDLILETEKYIFTVNASLQPINEAVTVLKDFLPFFVLVVLIMSLLLTYAYSKYITKPIKSITQTANSMSELDFTKKLKIKRADELGILSDSINHLSKNLETALNDVSEANQQLQIEYENELRQEEARKEFVANVSHEIKSPLGVIKSYSEGVKDAIQKEKRDYYIDVILDEVDNMSNLIDELLYLAKYDAGRVNFNFTDINIRDELNKCIRHYKELTKTYGHTIHLSGDFTNIIGDSNKLVRVFSNLISNALKYSLPHSDIYIEGSIDYGQTIRMRNPSEPIDLEDLKKIWQRFYKLDESHERNQSGTGLGLSIVKSILDSHQATYTTTCRESTFIIDIQFKASLQTK